MTARSLLPPLAIGLLLAIVSWRSLPAAQIGLDPSWSGALHIGRDAGLDWGSDIIWTYGPLGFLKIGGPWYSDTSVWATLYALVTRAALAATLWAVGRRTIGSVSAVLAASAALVFVEDPMLPLMFAAALWVVVLAREPRDRTLQAFAVGAGAVAGFEMLLKLNTGAALVALGAVALAFAPRSRLRLLALYLGSAGVSALAWWLIAGQSLGALPTFASGSLRIMSGFSSAMALDAPETRWTYSAALLVVAVSVGGAWLATERRERRVRAGAVALVAVLAFPAWKNGFVRADPLHVARFFGTMLPALILLPWGPALRGYGRCAVVGAFIALLALGNRGLSDVLSPFERTGDAWADVSLVVRPGEREEEVEEARARARERLRLDRTTLGELRGRSVHVVPWETSVVWAYGLEWKPAPIFQDYQAYTAWLDQRNADALLGGDGPERILLSGQVPLDQHVHSWEAPAATRALLCRYVPVHEQTDTWLVLERLPASRCGPARHVGTTAVEWGEPLVVPPPTEEGVMTMMKLSGAEPGLGGRLEALLFRGDRTGVTVDRNRRRMTPQTASQGLLLHVPEGFDYPHPFARGLGPGSLVFERDGADGELRAEFYEVPMR